MVQQLYVFFCLDTLRWFDKRSPKARSGQAPETKNQEQTTPPHLQPCIAFVHSSRAFSKGCFCKKIKSSVFINISVLAKLF